MHSAIATNFVLKYIDAWNHHDAKPVADHLTPDGIARKYMKSGLSNETFERLKSRLTDLMTNDRTYLYSDLTLPKLAHLMHCSVNCLSQVINAGFGMSFFDFLNRHRIEAAKRLLIQSDNRRQSIITVAYAVGFNSNSAFYTAFKNSCGQIPAQFRREHAQDP